MRIAFVGKGGSGKTTLSALFSRYLALLGKPVLAIDADINQHLALALGAPEGFAAPALAADMRLLKEYVRGANPRIGSADEMVKTTPPGHGSRLLRLGERNPVFTAFSKTIGGVTHLATGEFESGDIGVKCFHSKTGAVELLLNHLVDGKGEYVVVDMTAGADAFASGLFAKFDLLVVVAEPTRQALGVWEQYQAHGAGYDLAFALIGNKVEDASDEAFLRAQVGEALLSVMPRSKAIRAMERGETTSLEALEPRVLGTLEVLRAALDDRTRDWEAMRRQSIAFHLKNAASWANAAVGRDLSTQVDPDFRYPA
ncbi:MAG: ATP-binding protein [Patescibacteria group bacterium]|nr:MAG: ATP-binding protein [Patescibacteria group bacterium]